MKSPKQFYRYEAIQISDGPYPLFELKLGVFKVVEETPKGYWINSYSFHVKEKWIPKEDGRKRYARTTKKKALDCYIYRTKMRINYLKMGLEKAEGGLEEAKKIKDK